MGRVEAADARQEFVDRGKNRLFEANDLELKELHFIFSTEDALVGLSSADRKLPMYQGK